MRLALAWAGIAAGVAVVATGSVSSPRPAVALGGMAAWCVAGGLWWLVVRRARGVSLRAVWVGAVALRVVAGIGDPRLSDDLNRYVWEGGLVARGVSPYGVAPADPRRAQDRERWPEAYAGVNHPEVPAAYPPLAQGVHAAVTALAGGPGELERALLALRLAYGAFDLLCLVPLVALLRRRGLPAGLAVVWGWSPLVAVESAGSGHFDVLGVLLLLAGLVAAPRARVPRVLASVALAAGALVKLVPLVVLPYVARRRPRDLALGLLVFGAAWVPVALAGPGWLEGLSQYALRWEAASLVYRFVEAPIGAVLERDGGLLDARRVARLVVGALWLAVALREWRRPPDAVRSAGVLVGALLVLSPTLHPWYLVWIVPFVALRPSAAWLALLSLAPLLYAPLSGWTALGVWHEPAWLWPVVALPFLALRAVESVRERAP